MLMEPKRMQHKMPLGTTAMCICSGARRLRWGSAKVLGRQLEQ